MANALEGLLGTIQATPRNKLLGLLADGLKAADRYANKPDPTMPGGKANPPLSLLSDLASLRSLAVTADRASYGEPLTNAGVANVPFLKPETADSLMTLAPMAWNALRGAERVATKGSNALVRAITGNPEATGERVIDYARSMVPANPATVWHSSPYKFDKFAAGKAGTGEGNASFGAGTYLAESPEASGVGGNYFNQFKRHPSVKDTGGPYAYKVDLPDEAINKMLDWDKPLRRQPKVVKQFVANELSDIGYSDAIQLAADVFGANTAVDGKFINQFMSSHRYGSSEKAAEAMRKAGIPGIRYLDGSSRKTGSGTSNFVVFQGNEGLLSILERNN